MKIKISSESTSGPEFTLEGSIEQLKPLCFEIWNGCVALICFISDAWAYTIYFAFWCLCNWSKSWKKSVTQVLYLKREVSSPCVLWLSKQFWGRKVQKKGNGFLLHYFRRPENLVVTITCRLPNAKELMVVDSCSGSIFLLR